MFKRVVPIDPVEPNIAIFVFMIMQKLNLLYKRTENKYNTIYSI